MSFARAWFITISVCGVFVTVYVCPRVCTQRGVVSCMHARLLIRRPHDTAVSKSSRASRAHHPAAVPRTLSQSARLCERQHSSYPLPTLCVNCRVLHPDCSCRNHSRVPFPLNRTDKPHASTVVKDIHEFLWKGAILVISSGGGGRY
jgi:hypothetical protein